jgi:NAD(P)-dependent dehydrogenase (short-subunit alcohol dehydrogenase family)
MSALQGKVALVTGASSGLGAETTQLFSRQGATVFGIGRHTGRLAEVRVPLASLELPRRSIERFPKSGEGRCATSRVLHHPPMSQSVEHFRVGPGALGRPAPDHL